MASYRLKRIDGDLQRDLSIIISDKIKDKRLIDVPVSVTRVKATPDLKEAKVYVSIPGDEATKKEAMEALKHASGFLRTELSQLMSTYNTPALRFILDNSVEYGNKIDKILEELRESGQISDLTEEGSLDTE